MLSSTTFLMLSYSIFNASRCELIFDKSKSKALSFLLISFINPPLTKELRGLRESQKKIEKGKGYTDDMSDALAGALWSCSQDRFFKKNNEAISEIIKHTGNMHQSNMLQGPTLQNINRNFSGVANQLRSNNKPNLGFRYGV